MREGKVTAALFERHSRWLAAKFAQLALQPDAPPVLVRPEASTHYALVTDLLAAARNADVRRISLEPANR